MRRWLPSLGVVMILGVIVIMAGVVIDRTVERLPDTTKTTQNEGNSDPTDNSHKDNDKTSRSDSGAQSKTSVKGGARSQRVPGLGVHGQSAWGPHYRTWKIFGTNIAGLEFSGLFQPNTEQTYSYFKGKGMNTVRLPFDWNELQPDLYGEFDPTAKQYLDTNIQWARQHSLAVILDAHNYGRRYVTRDGGFKDDFTSNHQHTFRLPYGDQDSANGTLTFRDFGRGVAGTAANPVAPAQGYRVTFDVKIDAFEGSAWNEFYMDTFYQDEDNRYSLVANPVTHHWELRQTIHGVTTILASGSKNWNIGQYYSVAIAINQTTSGRINVLVDGSALFPINTVSSSPALAHGKISMYPSGLTATIRHFTLDIAGDTTSGGPVERRVTDAGLPLEAWKDFWTKIATAYRDDPTILGYDHNEPHDMPIPTEPNNYSADVAAKHSVPLATVTAMGQSMLDAIRAAGDRKFVIANMDHWANTHHFTTQYGTDPTPWIIDSLPHSKVVYSGHYYFDSDHSGQYGSGAMPQSNTAISADVVPFFAWCQNRKLICYEGEFGVPNTTQWQPALTHFLSLMKQYDIWWTQWAGGDIYSSPTTLQPTNSFMTDRLQMTTIEPFLKL